MTLSGATKVYGVIGDPIAHSLSPLIHNTWMRALSADAVYVPLHLTHPDPAAAIADLARMGLSGLNITLPHKLSALAAASGVSDTARQVGAANTLCPDGAGGWIAHNTDVAGFAHAAESALGDQLEGSKVVLIGAGGAARAAAFYLRTTGVELAILNRTRATAERLVEEFGLTAEVAEMSELTRLSEQADLVVNSASLGHAGEALPDLAPGKGRAFLDLSYGKAADPVLTAASEMGWAPHDGLGMLVAQAAAAFELWFSKAPDQLLAMEACRKKLGLAT